MYVFRQVEFVDKNNLEAQNPRRGTSIPSVSVGLIQPKRPSQTGLIVHFVHFDLHIWGPENGSFFWTQHILLELFNRPGLRQGLLYKHRCYWLID